MRWRRWSISGGLPAGKSPEGYKVSPGFCISANVPSLKLQFQLVGEPVEMSVNATANGADPAVALAVKAAATIGVGQGTDRNLNVFQ